MEKMMMRVRTEIDGRVKTAIEIAGGVILTGPPGTGKTSLLESIAEESGWEKVFYQAHPQTDAGELLYQLLPDEETTSGIRKVDGTLIQALKKCKEGKDTMLILDEWDKTRPSVDGFLLDFIQNKRISVPGMELEWTPGDGNLYVCLTSNEMREFSEPLLRRLPTIALKHLPPSLVRKALELSHPNSLYIEPAVRLYVLTVRSGMSKPATIQELRQLLDAIERLGKDADWDELVRMFVTKTEENHELLRNVEREADTILTSSFWREEEENRLNIEVYEKEYEEDDGDREEEIEEKEKNKPRLPRPVINQYSQHKDNEEENPTEEDLLRATLIVPTDDIDSYSGATELIDYDAKKIEHKGNYAIIKKPLKVRTRGELNKLSDKLRNIHRGEVEIRVLRSKSIRETISTLRKAELKVKKLYRGGVVLTGLSGEVEAYIHPRRRYISVIGLPSSIGRFLSRLSELSYLKQEDKSKNEEASKQEQDHQGKDLITFLRTEGILTKLESDPNIKISSTDIENIEQVKEIIERKSEEIAQRLRGKPPLEKVEEIDNMFLKITGQSYSPSISTDKIPLIHKNIEPSIGPYDATSWVKLLRQYVKYLSLFILAEKLSEKGYIKLELLSSVYYWLEFRFDKDKGTAYMGLKIADDEILTSSTEIKERIFGAITKIAGHIKWLISPEQEPKKQSKKQSKRKNGVRYAR